MFTRPLHEIRQLFLEKKTSYVATYLLALLGALGGVPNQVEHEAHLFLASHYASHFFSLWDPRWYGGFWVTGHPPLVHEWVALMSGIPGMGLERAYAILTVIAALLWIFSCQQLLLVMNGRHNTTDGTILIALNPLLYFFLFPLGQLPFLLGITLGILASVCVWQFYKHKDPVILSIGFLLIISAMTAHPLGFLGTLPGLTIYLISSARMSQKIYIILGGLVATAVAAAVLLPFLQWIVAKHTRVLPLAKFSLTNLHPTAVMSVIATCVLLVMTIMGERNRRTVVFMLLSVIFIAACTVNFRFISEDKLLFLALTSALFSYACGLSVPEIVQKNVICGTCIVGFFLTATVLSHREGITTRHYREATRELIKFFNQEEYAGFRYLTLGLGNERLELSRHGVVETIDGGMPWLRVASGLEATPFYSYDDLPLDDPLARHVLKNILQQSDTLGLRFVVNLKEQAVPFLESAGFRMRNAWKGGVVVWERINLPQKVKNDVPLAEPIWRLLWGFLPLLFCSFGLVGYGLWLRFSVTMAAKKSV